MAALTKREVHPPELAGYSYVDLVGQGGFADVFRYQEHHPGREVAVKVLTEVGGGEGRRQFDAEAKLMAQLATHPSIVPIYKADVSPDGRPYLVMELCTGASLAVRYRNEQIPVPELLEIGIRISAAVETAHRAGILHRDIKPHNILTNAYGNPKLTDFGIAVVSGEAGDQTTGLSIPWSPPEMFADNPPEDVRSDVYSLAATLYTLVAGRSPFEVPGGANDSHTLISRIERQSVPRLTRADVPDLLNDVLLRAMSKRTEERYSSATAFARALQEVQISLHMSPTKIDVLDSSPERPVAEDDDGRTRIRPITVIVPEALEETPQLAPTPQVDVDAVPVGSDETIRKLPTPAQLAGSVPATPDTIIRAGQAPTPSEELQPDPEPSPNRRRWVVVLGVGLAAVIVVIVVAAQLLGSTPPRSKPASLDQSGQVDDVVPDAGVPAVVDLTGQRDGTQVTYTWTNPEPEKGDFYTWVRIDDEQAPHDPVHSPRLTFVPKAGTQGCVQVSLVRANGQASEPSAPACPRGTP